MIFNFIFLVGLTFLTVKVVQIILNILSARQPYNLKQRYGEGWVLVTGATDGLGKGFCQVLAQKGFNLCVFGRNEEKTNSLCRELIDANPDQQIKVKPIIGDFSKCISCDNFIPKIKEQLRKHIGEENVCMLINNVGVEQVNAINDKSYDYLRDLVSINVGSQTLMTKLFIEDYLSGDKRKAILNVSSIMAQIVTPLDADYSASKTYNDKFSRSLSFELSDRNVDVLSLRPLYITTKMTGYAKGNGAITPTQCANAALNNLGKTRETNGHITHILQSIVLSNLPDFVVGFIVKKFYSKLIRSIQRRRTQQQEKKKD